MKSVIKGAFYLIGLMCIFKASSVSWLFGLAVFIMFMYMSWLEFLRMVYEE